MLKKENLIYLNLTLQIFLIVSFFTYVFIQSEVFNKNSVLKIQNRADSIELVSPAMSVDSTASSPHFQNLKTKSSSPSLFLQTAEASQKDSNQYLVKTGNINGRVGSLKNLRIKLKKVLLKHQAQLLSENESTYNQRKNLNLQLKVPSKEFESFLTDLSELSVFLESKSSQVVDKFKDYKDLEASIQNKKLLRKRYRSLLKNAKQVKDLLKIERELANVQNSLDQFTRQLDSLKDQISMSRVSAHYYEAISVAQQKNKIGLFQQLIDSFYKGFSRVKSFILLLITFWPFILFLCAGAFYMIRKLKSKD